MNDSPRKVAFTAAASLLAVLAGCAATRSSHTNADPGLARSAAVLRQNAYVFAQHSQDEGTRYSSDANLLQREADQFASSVESSSDVKDEFNRLSQAYQAVRGDVSQLNTAEARTDLQPVTQAYQDVATGMQGYAGGNSSVGE
jgi:hypothetical protein